MTETSITPITFLDPQPTPGDEDRIWFSPSRTGTGIYSVTRSSCSCPAGTFRPEMLCAHRRHLLECLQEPDESVAETRR